MYLKFTSTIIIFINYLAALPQRHQGLRMEMIKNIPVHMDYVGQGRAEKLYQVHTLTQPAPPEPHVSLPYFHLTPA